MTGRLTSRLAPSTWVLLAALVVRCALLPYGPGQDFIVWDLATRATLDGHNIYAHHPNYPHGPFAYFPLFLYLELPFQWLALHSAMSFTVLGKLPILAADLAAGWLIADAVRARTQDTTVATWCAVGYLFNPLVLFNHPWYGRFDSLVVALLLLAVRRMRPNTTRGAVAYGLAIASKTFPGLFIFGFARWAGRSWRRYVLISALTVLVITAPYLGSARAVFRDVFLWDARKTAGGLTWQHPVAAWLPSPVMTGIGWALFVVLVGGAVWLAQRLPDPMLYLAATLMLFILCNKVILEQYLVWPLPFLIVIAAVRPRLQTAALVAYLVFTVTGTLANEQVQPLGRSPQLFDWALLAVAGYFLWSVAHAETRDSNDEPNPTLSTA